MTPTTSAAASGRRSWRRPSCGTSVYTIFRHSFASLLVAQGESGAYVKDQMGDHSIRVTVDTYGHLVPDGNKAAVDRLDERQDATIRNPDATTPAAAGLSER